jgi:predicted Zn-dependent protease
LQIRKGDLEAAARELDAAAVAAPSNPEVVATRGLLALAAGRADEAATLLRQAEGDLPNRLGIVLALARAEIASGRPGDARTELRRVLAAAPRSLPLRFVLAEAELALGNAAETLSIASELKAEYPAQSAGYILEAEASLAARRYGAAANSYGAAFERDGRWSVMARWLGALELAGQNDEMLRIAERWVAANPQDVTGTLTLAGLLQNADRGQEALAVYEIVLGLDGNNIIGLNNAAWLRHELSQPGALAYAERSYALAPDNAAVLDTLGWILLSENREAEAVEYLSRAQQLAPSAPEIRYHLATALAANDRPAEARAMLTPLLEPAIDFEHKAEAARLLESL